MPLPQKRVPKRAAIRDRAAPGFWSSWWTAKGPILHFTLRFAGFSALFFALSLIPWVAQGLQHLLNLDARLASSLLNGLGESSHASQNHVVAPSFAIAVNPECSAGDMMALFSATLLAIPVPWMRRIAGIAAGILFIALLNMLRIVTVFWTGVHHPTFFTTLHEELWPGLLVLALLLLILGWCRSVLPNAERQLSAFRTGLFAGVFVLLLIPWPGWSTRCGNVARELGTMVFSTPEGDREITFEPLGEASTRIVIVNRTLMNADGSGPVRNLDFNTVAVLWRPVCLLLALAAATRLPWRKHLAAFGVSGLGLLGYSLAALAFAIWNESTEVALVQMEPVWKDLANEVQTALVRQLTIAAPVFLWLWAAFPITSSHKAES
jgi:exosortase/archaeosortase family protein